MKKNLLFFLLNKIFNQLKKCRDIENLSRDLWHTESAPLQFRPPRFDKQEVVIRLARRYVENLKNDQIEPVQSFFYAF